MIGKNAKRNARFLPILHQLSIAFIILYSAYFVKPKRKEIFSVRILRLEKLYGMCYNRTKLPETLAKPGKSEPERNQCL